MIRPQKSQMIPPGDGKFRSRMSTFRPVPAAIAHGHYIPQSHMFSGSDTERLSCLYPRKFRNLHLLPFPSESGLDYLYPSPATLLGLPPLQAASHLHPSTICANRWSFLFLKNTSSPTQSFLTSCDRKRHNALDQQEARVGGRTRWYPTKQERHCLCLDC